MEDCIFCKIASGALPTDKVFEDDLVFAFFDQHPKAKGHTLVIPKVHYQDIASTPDEVLSQMMPKLKMIAQKLMNEFNSSGFNLSVNNGASAGQEVFHLHFHIVPRS